MLLLYRIFDFISTFGSAERSYHCHLATNDILSSTMLGLQVDKGTD
jgi:hypothetical protein